MARERPVGITVLACLAILVGAIQGLAALGILGLGAAAAIFGGPVGIGVGLLTVAIAIVILVTPFLYILFGVGALKLRAWAWWLGIVASVLSVGGMVLQILGGESPGFFRAVFGILILAYLLSRKVRSAFGT